MIKEVIFATVASMIMAVVEPMPKIPEPVLYKGHATAYCDVGYTKSGEWTRDGICAAKEEWLGKSVVVYKRLPDGSIGDYIGTYEILDTGGTKGLKEGRVIDVWVPDMDAVQDFADLTYEDGCQGKIIFSVIR